GVQVLVGRVGRDVDQEELLDGPGDGGQVGDPGGRAELRGRRDLPGATDHEVAGSGALLHAADRDGAAGAGDVEDLHVADQTVGTHRLLHLPLEGVPAATGRGGGDEGQVRPDARPLVGGADRLVPGRPDDGDGEGAEADAQCASSGRVGSWWRIVDAAVVG